MQLNLSLRTGFCPHLKIEIDEVYIKYDLCSIPAPPLLSSWNILYSAIFV